MTILKIKLNEASGKIELCFGKFIKYKMMANSYNTYVK